MINNRKSLIQDDYIRKYLAEKKLDLTAMLDGSSAYRAAELVIIADSTNCDSKKKYFDGSAVEAVIELLLQSDSDAIMAIKSTTPVEYTKSVLKKYQAQNIPFSPEFLWESKALYDNRYLTQNIVGTDENKLCLLDAAYVFVALLKEGAIKKNKNTDTLFMGFAETEAVNAKGTTVIIHESTQENSSTFFRSKVVNNLEKFKRKSKAIVPNQYDSSLDDMSKKVYI